MKLIVLLLLVPILLGLTAAKSITAVDQYGRLYRVPVGRAEEVPKEEVSEVPVEQPEYQELSNDDDDDDTDDDEDDDDDVDDDDESGIYPPDFAKLFPNPDGRPVGPDAHDSYQKHHPANHQPSRPSHGPAASPGPAASRGPVAQHRPPQQTGGPSPGYARPQHDARPPKQGGPGYGPRPQYDGPPAHGPARREYNRPPPGPPPQRPEYRTDNFLEETGSDEVPRGRQLYYVGGSRQMGPVYNRNMYGNNYNRRNYQPYVPNRRYQRPRTYAVAPSMVRSPMMQQQAYAVVPARNWPVKPMVRGPVMPQQAYTVVQAKTRPAMQPMVRGPVAVSRQRYGRDYPRTSPFSRYSIHSDYNPEYIINPTAMLSRRKFRYHHSQRVPHQRIPLYPGYWPNPWIGHHFQRE